ncbi:hypothetical protein NC652_040596 [Populus alba x Populus x berolinensis]|uniref:Uncharacterized protein n=1 Tax=Populus alba x Populus x berolinensis TaxID=444605 RepID=A0AAD6L964_9ROSI|nr:hypothetical protein NC652_040596 [Populus alba x Populus x berolinensis]KAJ6951380.1 hypothetical protein NC653_040708 [Populus alba x Populus x berolinensis]
MQKEIACTETKNAYLEVETKGAKSSSAAFIGQRRLCAGNGWLDNGLQGDDSR